MIGQENNMQLILMQSIIHVNVFILSNTSELCLEDLFGKHQIMDEFENQQS